MTANVKPEQYDSLERIYALTADEFARLGFFRLKTLPVSRPQILSRFTAFTRG